jgi:hypothetical protein
MSDQLKSGVDWLAAQLTAKVSRTVSYSRQGVVGSLAVAATLGQTPFRVEDVNHSRLIWSDRDYLIDAALLAPTFGTPLKGDQIVDGTETYEVQPYNGEPHYRKSDPYGVKLRIHCKRVK